MVLNRSTLTFIATLTLAIVLVCWVIFRVDQQSTRGAQRTSWQDADVPASAEVLPNPWLEMPGAWVDASVPTVTSIAPVTAASDEVFAAADGVVIFSGIHGGDHAVILGHRSLDGARFESIYAPLIEVSRKQGELVARGMVIGRLGGHVLGPIFRELPAGIDEVEVGKSPIAEVLEATNDDTWMSLSISNAEKMLELSGEVEVE